MRVSIPLKRPWFIAGIIGIAGTGLCLAVIFFLNFDPPGYVYRHYNYTKPALAAGQDGLGLPVRLKIPKINVNARIEPMGLTADGAVDVPKGPSYTAWFNLGPRPGEIGSAVITGHFGPWKDGEKSVFDDLSKLSKGDSLTVEDEKGTITTFVVRALLTLSQDADAPEVFSSSDEKVHLNLITCSGVWNKTQKSYSNRLIVFTDKAYESQ